MKKLFVLIICFMVFKLNAQGVMEEEKVKKAIQYYFDGTAKGNVDLLKKGFTPDCKIYFVNEKGELDFYDQQQFHEIVMEASKRNQERINKLLSVEITSNMAMAKSRSDYPDFYFMDYLVLLKLGEEWKIVSKATVRTSK